jgi:uncharacterized protein YkwD
VAKLLIPKLLTCLPSAFAAAAVLAFAAAFTATAADARNGASSRDGALWRNGTIAAERVTDLPQLEVRLLAQINDLRHAAGLAPLRASAGLAAAAREQSLSMAEHGFFGHESFGGSPFWKRVETKYRRPAAGSWRVGENLVWSTPRLSARQALSLWLQSPPHRQNLLTPGWREVGIAAVHASSAPGVYAGHNVTILTADFGVRR